MVRKRCSLTFSTTYNMHNNFDTNQFDLDTLLATRKEFLFGDYLESAKGWGTSSEEEALFEWNARRVLTLWAENAEILEDYARKQWSGLISGYYHARWKWYLSGAAATLKTGEPFDEDAFQRELHAWMIQWSDSKETYPSRPAGDCVAIAARLWAKYHGDFR